MFLDSPIWQIIVYNCLPSNLAYWKTFTLMKKFDEKKRGREITSVNVMLNILEQSNRY